MSKDREIKKLKRELKEVEKKLYANNDDKLILANILANVNRELEESLHQEKQFIASVSHELRTPMTSIIGYGELLEDTNLNSKQRRYVRSIIQSSSYLLSLINDLLDVAKFKDKRIELSPDITDITDIVSECATLIESKISKNVDFQVELPVFDYKIKADEKRLKQIILNLLSNAAKFTKDGYIKFYLDDIVESQENQLELVIHIEDTGGGVAKEVRDKLFEPFSSADIAEGTGLGLFISQELALLMDGNISVESKEGVGSHFTLRISVEKSTLKEIGKSLREATILMCSNRNSFSEILNREFTRVGVEKFEHYDIKNMGVEGLLSELLPLANSYHIVILDIDILDEKSIAIAKVFSIMNPNIKLVAYLRDDFFKIEEVFHLSIYKPVGYQNFIDNIERLYNQESQQISKADYKELKILLVEDIEINRIYEVEMLKNFFGIDCDTAENGKIAVDKAKNNYYDLILMDMRMPVMGGLEATREIRKFNTTIPIVCMSANVYKENKMSAEESGMNDFIEKPLERKDIEKSLLKLLNYKKLNRMDTPKSYKRRVKNFLRENFDEVTVKNLYASALKSIAEGLDDIELHSRERLLVKQLREDFHKLKGVLLNLGIKEIASQASDLQKYAEQEDIASIDRVKPDFIEALNSFLNEGSL